MADITFTRAELELFRAAYNRAKEAGKTQFIFEDRDFFVSYAKYLIEYLDNQLN